MTATGEASIAAAFLARRPRVLALLLLQALAGYCGILVYLESARAAPPRHAHGPPAPRRIDGDARARRPHARAPTRALSA